MELWAAIDGWQEAHGSDKNHATPLSYAEFEELVEKFPDVKKR